jgi:hypothetical protein
MNREMKRGANRETNRLRVGKMGREGGMESTWGRKKGRNDGCKEEEGLSRSIVLGVM